MTASHRTSPVEQQARDRTYRYESNTATADPGAGGGSEDRWQERARLVLTPVAAPSILGLFGFFAATLLVGSNMAHWWGTTASALAVFPFAVMLGGVRQFLAGIWPYRALFILVTAMLCLRGAF